MSTKNTVPVGATPVPKYATWAKHREAMRREAERARADGAERKARRLAPRLTPRP